MILSITKKATVIYQLIISLSFFLFSQGLFAAEELANFCFSPGTNLNAARDSLGYLLLPNEKTFLRPEQRCMDVLTSTDRVKLLEKYLRLRYTLVEEDTPARNAVKLQEENCRLELKKTVDNKAGINDVNIGQVNTVSTGQLNKATSETTELLLSYGKPAAISIGLQGIFVECRKGPKDNYNITFALTENGGSTRITTDVTVRKNETIDVGQITKDLNEKQRILGYPQTTINTYLGTEVTTYQLQVTN